MKILLYVLALLLLTPVAFAQEAMFSIDTKNGHRIEIYSRLAPLQINRIHSWELVLINAQGEPVSAAKIEVLGGMPEHDHGLPTQPRVTEELEAGRYLLEGVRFHMPGLWQINFSIDEGMDKALLEFEL